ncbi:MAG: cobyric acid synthase [Pseudomonadales bacterium]
MTANSLMLQGTGSNVGKSVLVAGLCRAAKLRGLKVAPFKPQNMSNNAAVCQDGGEIGRAQALQARACGLAPETRFNPVLLKPQSDQSAQIIVNGEVAGLHDAAKFFGKARLKLLPQVLASYDSLAAEFDLVIVEGAGSPAETNLRDGDIANMGFATAARVPVCLVADIDRGGSIASLVGTKAVLSAVDQAMIQGFMINKFRGDPYLFTAGLKDITAHTHWHGYGVIPWLPEVTRLPEEDAVPLQNKQPGDTAGLIKIAVPMLSRIANFDDLDPLSMETNVQVNFIPPGKPLPMDAHAVIIPGTKSTLGDMQFLKTQGWDIDIYALARQGRTILGICGGLQLLGQTLTDSEGSDGAAGKSKGLGLLDISTTMQTRKTVRHTSGQHIATGATCNGYEIHVGATSGPDAARPFLQTQYGPDGACNPAGNIAGTYLHGIFNHDDFRSVWLKTLRSDHSSDFKFDAEIDAALDQLAASLESCLDIDRLLQDSASFR